MPDERPNMVAIIKAEMIWVVIILLLVIAMLLAVVLSFKAGRFAEKIDGLEYTIFEQGLHHQSERDEGNDIGE